MTPALLAFLKDPKRMEHCVCGAKTCDVRARIRVRCPCGKLLQKDEDPCSKCGWVPTKKEPSATP